MSAGARRRWVAILKMTLSDVQHMLHHLPPVRHNVPIFHPEQDVTNPRLQTKKCPASESHEPTLVSIRPRTSTTELVVSSGAVNGKLVLCVTDAASWSRSHSTMVEEWHRRDDAYYKDDAHHIAMATRICKYRDHLCYFSRCVFVELVFPSPHIAVHLVAA